MAGVGPVSGLAPQWRQLDAPYAQFPGGIYNPGVWVVRGQTRWLVRAERTLPISRQGCQPSVLHSDGTLTPVRCIGFDPHARLEDFRPFVCDSGQVLVSHSMVYPDRVQMALSELEEGDGEFHLLRRAPWVLPRLIHPVEKNWVLSEQEGQLSTVYTCAPLETYRLVAGATWAAVDHEVPLAGRWSGIWPVRNSTHLIPFRGGQLGWFHQERRGVYYHGAYWLGPDGKQRGTEDLFDGKAVQLGHKPGVLYVSSQYYTEASDTIALYAGVSDQWCAWALLSGEAVWAALHG